MANQIPQTGKNKIEEGDHITVNIEDINGQDPSGSQTKKPLNQIFAQKFKDLDNLSIKSRTIFKVNVWLRELNPAAYTPKTISIGPYHKKNPQLSPMENYKLLYLERFLKRKEGLDVESCISELEKMEEEAQKCYDNQETDEFCLMLLLDGCFVVEFIRESRDPQGKDVIIIDNIYGYIFRDLMLLENQLPFFVLNKLHDMTKRDDEPSLAILAGMLLLENQLPFFVLNELHDMTKRDDESLLAILAGISFPLFVDLPRDNIKHLLHLAHILSCHGNRKKESENNDDPEWHKVMPNATELSEAGAKFAKASNSNSNKDKITSLFDIKFENGLMTIPCFRVDDDTEILLRNLIAYEQQSCYVQPKYFSDFATFMDDLIESDKDVNLLRQKGIIVNWIGEDKEVANLFNKIGKGVTIYDHFYYKEECIKATKHCEAQCNKMMASLLHNYFSSPWVGASTLAAIVLLILTGIQTILAFVGPIKK